MNQKYYSIEVIGPAPMEAEEGFLNKSGNPINPKKIKVPPGLKSIPNFSQVWGLRKVGKDGKPNGDIEFLPWGDPKGGVVPIRYMNASTSLDKQFQESQKLELPMEAAEIILQVGINDFDVNVDARLVAMLKVHGFNGDSESRNPQSEVLFHEYNSQERLGKKTQEIEIRRTAEDFVLKTKDDLDMLKVLANIFDLDAQSQNEVLQKELIEKVEDSPKKFLEIINERKERSREQLAFAVANDIVVGGADKELQVREKSVLVPVLVGSIQEGDDTVQYLMDRYMEPEVFELVDRIRGLNEVYKELVLQ